MNQIQITLSVVLFVAFVCALIAFYRTPKEKRDVFFKKDKNISNPDYAPEYTKRDRILIALKYMVLGVLLFGVAKFYFFPWIERFLEEPHCFNYGGFSGVQILFYGLFVGFPLSLAFVLFLIEGPRSIKVIKLGQNPLPNEKVLRPTQYTYGVKAKMKPFVLLASLIVLLGFSVRGVFWANDIIRMASEKELPVCSNS